MGQPKTVWYPLAGAEDVPCRLSNSKGREVMTSLEQNVVKATHLIYFGPSVVIDESKRVKAVRDAEGNVLASDLDVLFVRRVTGGSGVLDHLAVDCRVDRGQTIGS